MRLLPIRFPLFALAAAALMSVAGCPLLPNPGNQNTDTVKGTGVLKPFSSPDELVRFLRTQANGTQGRGFLPEFLAGPQPANDSVAGGEGSGSAPPVEFSGTNVQEVGVDEADHFKTDGRYFYVGRGATLRILDTMNADGTAADLREVAALNVAAPISGLYLDGDTVILLCQDWGRGWGGPELAFPDIAIWPPYSGNATLHLVQVDVADRANPQIAAQAELDGSLVSSRLVNGQLILVLTVVPQVPAATVGQAQALRTVVPKFRRDGTASDLVPWQSWLRPEDPNGYRLTVVAALDAADVRSLVSSVAVVANAYTIYASTSALYVTDSTYEERDGIGQQVTTVHKFALGENGATYVASGAIDGQPLNQFSLGEFNGDLRIATQVQPVRLFTDGGNSGIGFDGVVGIGSSGSGGGSPGTIEPTPGNAQTSSASASAPSTAVYVLRQNGERLETIGSIENIEPGERMYAARFMGERGFLVTFRQIDPLFVLDLADPTNPRIAGELKIPGFSEYLHLVGENHLIGVGTAVTESNERFMADGIQLSLFDISDPAAPAAVQQIRIGQGWSKADATNDHKAFALYPRDGALLLALPAYTMEYANNSFWQPANEFHGVYLFDIDLASGFNSRGRLGAVVENNGWGGWVEWRRVAFIEDRLFAVSSAGVQSGSVVDAAPLSRVEFPRLIEDVPGDWAEPRPIDPVPAGVPPVVNVMRGG
jgi:inhibitor of cysteine peptidase